MNSFKLSLNMINTRFTKIKRYLLQNYNQRYGTARTNGEYACLMRFYIKNKHGR
jgi:hypothetical protein